jgi:photosystem II stability/assembly factor-like uncharacterized protein
MDRRLAGRQRHSLAAAALAAALATLAPASAGASAFADPLDTPAASSRLAATGLYNGLARAGSRIVAVGQRGHIVYSDDAGNSWQQAKVPVSSDLVAVTFPTPAYGWAVGHDGVVLHTSDGGATWASQLDGRALGKLLGYANKRLAEQGAENPFLDVWFANQRSGFVVGAFNLILRTEDGGRTWQPWLDRTDNETDLHLYAIRAVAGHLFIAGEQGLLMRLDPQSGRFRTLAVPYKGTFFGLAGDKDSVVAFGLRGNAFRSTDAGKTWTPMQTGVQVGLTAGMQHEGRLVLVSQAGHVLSSRDGAAFNRVKVERATPAAAVIGAGPSSVVIAGPRGLRTQRLD